MNNLFLSGLLTTFFAVTFLVSEKPLAAQTAPAKPAQLAPVPSTGKQVDVNAPVLKTPPEPSHPADASPVVVSPVGGKKEAFESDPAPQSATVRKTKSLGAAYIIGPEDILLIRVWGEANLSGQVTVGPDGMISLQLIDEVKADGLTPEQLKGVLTEKLKRFIKNPDVNVQVIRVNSRKFIILGEVSRPGSFSLTGPTTVMEALVSGGGFREFANPKKIYILRTEVNPQTKKPETVKLKFNYKDVSHGKNMEQNILIQNGDQIFVP
jgi:polysaccharide export outer membrane protein